MCILVIHYDYGTFFKISGSFWKRVYCGNICSSVFILYSLFPAMVSACIDLCDSKVVGDEVDAIAYDKH